MRSGTFGATASSKAKVTQHPSTRRRPSSWYWPTRLKLLVAALVVAAVGTFFIVVNPGAGREELAFVPSARIVARRVERIGIPPFNTYKLMNVACRLAPDHRHATCVGVEKRAGDQGAGAPVPKHSFRIAARFVLRPNGVVVPDCSEAKNVFCAE
jgi:hypothetical protein